MINLKFIITYYKDALLKVFPPIPTWNSANFDRSFREVKWFLFYWISADVNGQTYRSTVIWLGELK